jgi:hypothetical protein
MKQHQRKNHNMKNQKGNTMLIVLIFVALVLVGGYFFLNRGAPSNNQPSSQQQSNAIQNDSGLMSASNDLDSTNVDGIDTELNQNDTDASSF